MRRSVLAGLLATFAAAACQSGTEPPKPLPEPGRLIVSASVAGTAIRTVVVEVTAADLNPALVFNLTLDASDRATGTITVPAGSNRTITVRAYNAAGIETHRGQKTGVTINEGASNPSLTISVLSLAGDTPITVQLSSHTVSVSVKGGGLPSVVAGSSIELEAVVRDVDGNDVLPGDELKWASSAPAVATVGAGVVSGVMAGSATIMATYRGVGHAIVVSVTVPAAP